VKGEKLMGKLIVIIFVAFICIVPHHLAAAGLDGSSPLLCAVIEVFECSLASDCAEVTVEDVNIPQFIRVDFKNNKISSAEGNEEKRESAIKNFEQNNGMLILQGIEGGRGWGITVAEDTGKMTGTAAEDDGGFVVFGACIPD
jgi:hypothetical protein